MNMVKLGAVVITGALSIASFNSPVFAASPITDAFLSNLTPNVDFLDRSSRFALLNSKNAHLRDFAHSEAKEQTLAANALDEWIEADKNPVVAIATTPDANGVTTGRSVAVDGQQAPVVDQRLHMGQEDLDRLEGLEAVEFDDLYKTKQLDALTQIETDYQTYLVNGDDAALKAMAARELPKIKHRLMLLGKL